MAAIPLFAPSASHGKNSVVVDKNRHREARLTYIDLRLAACMVNHHNHLTVTDYRGHRQTLLPVREINLKA